MKVYQNAWFPEPAAKFMAFLESLTAKDGEAGFESDAVQMASGRAGLTFDKWMKSAGWE